MSCINNCIFTGRISQVPDLRTTSSDKKVCKFNIAVEDGYGDNKKCYYPTIIAWNGQAEFVSKLSVGTMIGIACKYTQRSWTDKNGNKKYAYEFVASVVQAMESKHNEETLNSATLSNVDDRDFEEMSSDDLPF